jgi:hypothetical protein
MTLTTLLIIAATVLSAIAVVQSHKSPLAWACFLLALAFFLPLVR